MTKIIFLISLIYTNIAFAGKIEVSEGSKVSFYQADGKYFSVNKNVSCLGNDEKKGRSRIINLVCDLNGNLVMTNEACDGPGFAFLNLKVSGSIISVTHHCDGTTIK